MEMLYFPTINAEATGKRIMQLRKERGLSVKDLQNYLGFDAPQAIYKWQHGKNLPQLEHVMALSRIFGVGMEDVLVTEDKLVMTNHEPDGSVFDFGDCDAA